MAGEVDVLPPRQRCVIWLDFPLDIHEEGHSIRVALCVYHLDVHNAPRCLVANQIKAAIPIKHSNLPFAQSLVS
jgi:hypothetical protein